MPLGIRTPPNAVTEVGSGRAGQADHRALASVSEQVSELGGGQGSKYQEDPQLQAECGDQWPQPGTTRVSGRAGSLLAHWETELWRPRQALQGPGLQPSCPCCGPSPPQSGPVTLPPVLDMGHPRHWGLAEEEGTWASLPAVHGEGSSVSPSVYQRREGKESHRHLLPEAPTTPAPPVASLAETPPGAGWPAGSCR